MKGKKSLITKDVSIEEDHEVRTMLCQHNHQFGKIEQRLHPVKGGMDVAEYAVVVCTKCGDAKAGRVL